MERALRILMLEDLPSDAELMTYELRQAENFTLYLPARCRPGTFCGGAGRKLAGSHPV